MEPRMVNQMLAEIEHGSSFLSHDSNAPACVEPKVPRSASQILAAYRRHDPRRQLQWRWQRASELGKSGEEPDPVYDDGWTRRAFGYQRLVDDHPAETLAEAMPDIHAACQLHATGNMQRWELEARILSRESPETIESKTGIAAPVVECYQKMFFNVLGRIDCKTYIAAAAIGQRPFNGLNVAPIWNHFGYFHGPCVLDSVIADFREAGKPDYTHLIADPQWWKGRSRFQRTIDRSISMLLFNIDSRNAMALFRMQLAFQALEQRGETSAQHEDMEDFVDAVLCELFSAASEADATAESAEELVA